MRVDDVWIGRNYTPISPVNQKGAVSFVIKTYRDDPELGQHGGVFSQYLEKHMNVGCTILCDAPKGRLKYMGL